jgi:uncharacterized delta-60 repeat protein
MVLLLPLVVLALASACVPWARAGSSIERDLTFGPDALGYNDVPTTQSSDVFAIALKAGGQYTGCGYFGNYLLIGQMTEAGNMDALNFNPPLGFLNLALEANAAVCLAVQTQPADQKSVFGGIYMTDTNAMVVGRVTAGGALDSGSFGSPAGYVLITYPTTDGSTPDSFVGQIQIQSNGYIVVGGTAYTSSGVSVIALARLDPSGTLDNGFGTSGQTTLALGDTAFTTGMVLQSDGNIVVAAALSVSGNPVIGLARFTTSGALDTTYGDGTGYILYDNIPSYALIGGVDIQMQGANQDKVVVSVMATDTSMAWVLRFNTDGSLDTGFASAGVATVTLAPGTDAGLASIAVANDTTDSILVAGLYEALGTSFLLKLTADGAQDATFGDSPAPVTGVLTMEQINPGEQNFVNVAKWDLNSKPVTAGPTSDTITLQRFLPSNAQWISFISPPAGQAATSNPQIYVNGACSQTDALVQVTLDGAPLFNVYSNARGVWAGGLSAPLAPGTYTLVASLIYDVDTVVASASTSVTIS